MARRVRECVWGLAAHYQLHMEVTWAPGGTGQCPAGRACAARLGDTVGGGLSRAGLRGVAQTPQVWRRRRGQVRGGHSGLSPSLPQPQTCNLVWLQPWGGESVPDGSVLDMGGGHSPLEVPGPSWQQRNEKARP